MADKKASFADQMNAQKMKNAYNVAKTNLEDLKKLSIKRYGADKVNQSYDYHHKGSKDPQYQPPRGSKREKTISRLLNKSVSENKKLKFNHKINVSLFKNAHKNVQKTNKRLSNLKPSQVKMVSDRKRWKKTGMEGLKADAKNKVKNSLVGMISHDLSKTKVAKTVGKTALKAAGPIGIAATLFDFLKGKPAY